MKKLIFGILVTFILVSTMCIAVAKPLDNKAFSDAFTKAVLVYGASLIERTDIYDRLDEYMIGNSEPLSADMESSALFAVGRGNLIKVLKNASKEQLDIISDLCIEYAADLVENTEQWIRITNFVVYSSENFLTLEDDNYWKQISDYIYGMFDDYDDFLAYYPIFN